MECGCGEGCEVSDRAVRGVRCSELSVGVVGG